MAESIAQRIKGPYVKPEELRTILEAFLKDMKEVRATVNDMSAKNVAANTLLNAVSGISGLALSNATVAELNVKD